MKVFIAGNIHRDAADFLKKKKFKVSVFRKDVPISEAEFLRKAKTADGIISLLSIKIDAPVITLLKNCKVIANYAVGYNNIDINAAKEHNIIVTNTPDVLTDATADITMGLALACARRFPEGDKLIRENRFTGWQPQMLMGIQLKGKNFGIIGAGRIGTAVATRAKSFGCNILYYSRSKNHSLEKLTAGKKVTLGTLLKNSDFVSLHVPLTPGTKHLLNKENMHLLKPSSIVINTARGEVVDEQELVNLLKKKRIFSAGFDVYYGEPDLNPELLKLDNVVLLPHLGSATTDARRDMALLAAKNVYAVLSGKAPLTPVSY